MVETVAKGRRTPDTTTTGSLTSLKEGPAVVVVVVFVVVLKWAATACRTGERVRPWRSSVAERRREVVDIVCRQSVRIG